MNRYQIAEMQEQEKQTYFSAVDVTAQTEAAKDGIKEVVRITQPDVYYRVKQLVQYGPVSYGDGKTNIIQGFQSLKGTWYSLIRKTSK